ncbi:hypothetical protein PRIPAC_94958, partial [Pristionchus pacificus]
PLHLSMATFVSTPPPARLSDSDEDYEIIESSTNRSNSVSPEPSEVQSDSTVTSAVNSEAEKKLEEKKTQSKKNEFTATGMRKKAEENCLKKKNEDAINISDRRKKREEAKSKAEKRRNDAQTMSKLICFAFLVVATSSTMALGKKDKEMTLNAQKNLLELQNDNEHLTAQLSDALRKIALLENDKSGVDQRNNAADRKIVVHQSDMSDEMKDYAIELAKKAIDMPGSESDSELLEIVTYIVLAFEKKFRGQWQCIAGFPNEFAYSHYCIKDYSINFSIGDINIVLCRTD